MLTFRLAQIMIGLRELAAQPADEELTSLEREVLFELESINLNGISSGPIEVTSIGTMVPRPPPYIRLRPAGR
jgi:hypothetical protein